jgi:hypothetical protein
MAKEVTMYRIFPEVERPGDEMFEPYYCKTMSVVNAEIARMEAWTGVKWLYEKTKGSPDLLIW